MHAAATQHAADDSVLRQQLSQLGFEELTGWLSVCGFTYDARRVRPWL